MAHDTHAFERQETGELQAYLLVCTFQVHSLPTNTEDTLTCVGSVTRGSAVRAKETAPRVVSARSLPGRHTSRRLMGCIPASDPLHLVTDRN